MGKSAIGACILVLALATIGEARIWTDTEGRTVEGEFVRFRSGQVVIKLTTGRPIHVNYLSLSDTDREYVRERLREDGEEDVLDAYDNAENGLPGSDGNAPPGGDGSGGVGPGGVGPGGVGPGGVGPGGLGPGSGGSPYPPGFDPSGFGPGSGSGGFGPGGIGPGGIGPGGIGPGGIGGSGTGGFNPGGPPSGIGGSGFGPGGVPPGYPTDSQPDYAGGFTPPPVGNSYPGVQNYSGPPQMAGNSGNRNVVPRPNVDRGFPDQGPTYSAPNYSQEQTGGGYPNDSTVSGSDELTDEEAEEVAMVLGTSILIFGLVCVGVSLLCVVGIVGLIVFISRQSRPRPSYY